MDGLGCVRRYLVEEGQLELFCFGSRTLLRGGFFGCCTRFNTIRQRGFQVIDQLLRGRFRSGLVLPLLHIHIGQAGDSAVAVVAHIGRFVTRECVNKIIHFHTRVG